MKTAKTKSKKFWKTDFLLSKVRTLKLCPLAILIPLKESPYIVPHLKAFIIWSKFWDGQRCGSTLSLWNPLLKISILLHKMDSGYKALSLSGCMYLFSRLFLLLLENKCSIANFTFEWSLSTMNCWNMSNAIQTWPCPIGNVRIKFKF